MATSYQAGKRPGFFVLLWRATRQVFHEATGTLFLLLALSWGIGALRMWRRGTEPWLWGGCAIFALLFVAFGLTSFLSARRVR